MKRPILSFSGKKLLTATFISASVLLASFSANATTIHSANIEILSNDKPSVQFAGSTSDALLFKVHLSNDNADNFTLTIKNSEGSVLYSKSFNDVNFEKQIKILKGDDSNRYYFTVTSSNKNLEETYVISSTVRTVDDISVNKL